MKYQNSYCIKDLSPSWQIPALAAALCFTAALALTPAWAQAQSAKTKIVVMNVEVHNIDETHIPALSEAVSTALQRQGQFEVISGRDLVALIGLEAQKQKVASCDETQCLAELGAALGAEKLLSTQISRVGESFLVNAKIIDVQKVKTDRRANTKVPGTQIADVLDAIPNVMESLFILSDNELRAAGIRTGPLSQRTLALASLGAGGIALGLGIGFGLKANTHHQNATNPDFDGAQLEIDRGLWAQGAANISFGVSALFVAGGAALFFFDDTEEKRRAFAALPVVTPDFAGTSFAFQF